MSSETKWTPGDWSLSYDTGSTRDVVAHPDPKPVCTVKHGWVTREQYAANAQLIASAPKLYEALSALTDWLEWSLEQSERAADEFKRDTGFLAPYKDVPADMDNFGALSAWREWYATENAKRIAAARTALASARGEG